MAAQSVEQERLALLANDIRVLVGQLNDAVKTGAEIGLISWLEVSTVLDVKGHATSYPSLSVRLQAEVH
jgi:hypothetical protein